MTIILSPGAETFQRSQPSQRRAWDGGISGKTICFLDNHRPNADNVLALIREKLTGEFGVKAIEVRTKEFVRAGQGSASNIALPKQVFAQVAREADGVVIAFAN